MEKESQGKIIIAVCADRPEDRPVAEALATKLGAPLRAASDITAGDAGAGAAQALGAAKAPASGPRLRFSADGLALEADGQSLRADLTRMLPRITRGRLAHELLVRAARLKDAGPEPVCWDAAAGFGEDALLLAAAGYQVRLFERDTIIAALLADALRRAAKVPELADLVRRMALVEGDSREALRAAAPGQSPDLVYLDPMFPARRKSGLVKKKFQLLHLLEPPCEDEEDLLDAALAARPRRIIVKRPLKGPYLGGLRPGYSISGKTIRYDCIVPPQSGGRG
jgi:16S rRNA (guanine1516-N2)-methyltransferase